MLQRQRTRSQTLMELGWPKGLTEATAGSIESFPVRFVVVDNSGSMQSMDGSRLVRTQQGVTKSIRATRWAELGDVVNEFSRVAMSLGAPTHFHLLNPTSEGQFFSIACADDYSAVGQAGNPCDLQTLKRVMETSPTGTTPLTEALQQIIRLIQPGAEKINMLGQKVVIVLATDGRPNDPNTFLRALQELQRLPVWVVVRLCTSEEDVVSYWSDLDAQVKLKGKVKWGEY